MHFLVTVAVLVYAPPSGGATARKGAAEAALAAAERARGVSVVGDALSTARRLQGEGWVAADELAFFGRAAQLVSDGRGALARVELERAEAAFAQAETLLRAELARAGVPTEAATAALWHGVALFELGHRSEAQRAWRRAVALEPTSTLTEAMVRPDVARAFGDAQRRRPSATLRIETDPDSVLFVDGRRASHVVDPVSVGEHLVVVRAPERRAAAALVDVPAAGASVTMTLTPEPGAAAWAMLEARPTADAIEALRGTLAVDAVLVAAISVDGGVLTFAAERRQSGCGSGTLTSTHVDELVRRLDEAPCRDAQPVALLEAAAIASPRPAPSARSSEARPPVRARLAHLWQRPWFWVTAVGVVGIGVVVAVNVWPRDASYSATLDFHQFSLSRR